MNNDDDSSDLEFIISETGFETNTKLPKKEKVDPSKNKKKKVDGVERKLWDVAKKYKTLLDSETVPPIEESEEDRETVEHAYQELETKRHWQLDARVYQSLTKMQRTRDAKIALEGTTEKERLRMIAWEVKIRTQPVIFIHGDSTLDIGIFRMHDNDAVRILEGDNKEILVEDEIVDLKGIAILADLPLRNLTKDEKLELKQEILKKFGGKTFTKQELNDNFDSIYADLISLMTREGELLLLKDGKKYRVINAKQDSSINSSDLESQSLVLKPVKRVKR